MKKEKMVHVPDGLENIKDESYAPIMMFLVGISFGLVLGFSIYWALNKVGY